VALLGGGGAEVFSSTTTAVKNKSVARPPPASAAGSRPQLPRPHAARRVASPSSPTATPTSSAPPSSLLGRRWPASSAWGRRSRRTPRQISPSQSPLDSRKWPPCPRLSRRRSRAPALRGTAEQRCKEGGAAGFSLSGALCIFF
jgi:hypothetical protein